MAELSWEPVEGAAVNAASRMENSEASMMIHFSGKAYERIKDSFDVTEEVKMDIKGKGSRMTYFMA